MTTPAQAYGHPNFVDDVPIQGPTDEGMRRLACCHAKGLPQPTPCVDCGDGPVPGWTRRTLSPTRVNFYGIGDSMGDRLGTNSKLLRGQSITSPNGVVSLVMQHDGDLVLRDNRNHRILWHSGTAGQGGVVTWMNWDGNLRVEAPGGESHKLWDNGAHGHKDAFARVQDDGQLFVWDGSNHQIWDAGASLDRPNPVPGGHGVAHTNFGGFNPFHLNLLFRAGGQAALRPSTFPPVPPPPFYSAPPPPPPVYVTPPPPPSIYYAPPPPPPSAPVYSPPPPPPHYTTVAPVYPPPDYHRHRHWHDRDHRHSYGEQPAPAYQPEYQAPARAPHPYIHSRVTGHSAMETRAYPIHHGRLHGTSDSLALAGCGGTPCWSSTGLQGPNDPAIDTGLAAAQMAWVQNALLILNDKIMSTSGSSCPTWADPTAHLPAAVQCFQLWWNTHYAGTGKPGIPLRTDGVFDEDTLCALQTITSMHPEDFPIPFPDPTKQFCKPASPLAAVAKVHRGIVNYLESLSTPAKVGIGVAAVAAVGGTVYAVTRRNTNRRKR